MRRRVLIPLLGAMSLGVAAGCAAGAAGKDDNGANHNINTVARCGNNLAEGTEICDGADLGGNDCTTVGLGFTGGTLHCNAACNGWDTSACTHGDTCGNGLIDGEEICDGANLDGNDCTTLGLGFTGGTLGCIPTCDGWDTSGCTGTGADGSTVDAHVDAGDAHVDAGDAHVDAGDAQVDAETDGSGPLCGNGVREPSELCDGADLAGNDCTTLGLGFTGGTLQCNAACDGWDTSACTGAATCNCNTDCPWQTTELTCVGGTCALPPGTRYGSNDTFPVVPCIPAPTCFGVDTYIHVPDSKVISSIVVHVEVTQGLADLMQVTLHSPGGQAVFLAEDDPSTCGLVGMYVGAFPISLTPIQSLSSLIGTNAQGTWRLHLYDSGATGGVALESWALYIQ